MNIRTILLCATSALIGAVACMVAMRSPTGAQPASEDLPAGVVARAGRFTISAEDVLARINEWEKPLDRNRQHLRSAYEYLLKSALLKCEAERLGIVITEEERKRVTTAQIEGYKAKLASEYGNAYTWDMFLKNQGLSEEEFTRLVYERSETMLQRRRVVPYFEMTNQSASYVQVRVINERDAVAVLAKVDAAREEVKSGKKASLLQEFQNIALLQSVDKQSLMTAFKGQGIPALIEEQVFDKLSPGQYSGVIKVADSDYRIVYLSTRTLASTMSYEQLKPQIEERYQGAADIDEPSFDRWYAATVNSKRHVLKYRIPGEPAHQPQPASKDTDGTQGKPADGGK